jgi:NADH:ubiquinone oxidoreductase subunit H
MLDLFFFLLMIFFLWLRLAFLTLLERKVLAYIHIPKGPNKGEVSLHNGCK